MEKENFMQIASNFYDAVQDQDNASKPNSKDLSFVASCMIPTRTRAEVDLLYSDCERRLEIIKSIHDYVSGTDSGLATEIWNSVQIAAFWAFLFTISLQQLVDIEIFLRNSSSPDGSQLLTRLYRLQVDVNQIERMLNTFFAMSSMNKQVPLNMHVNRDRNVVKQCLERDQSHCVAQSQTRASGSLVPTASEKTRRIFVLGVGNLGVLFATSLAKLAPRPPITLVVHRKELLEQWASDPSLKISRNGVSERMTGFDIEWWTDQKPDHGVVKHVADGGAIPNLLVTTKASAALPEIDRLRRYLDENSVVAFAQNGMCKLWPPHGHAYNSHRYASRPPPSWLACVTTHGVTSRGRYTSEHASVADLKIGSVLSGPQGGASSTYLAEQLARAPFLHGQQVLRADLWTLQLEKLVVNCIINPLTALLRCKNGYLFEKTEGPLMRLIDVLLAEASAVLQHVIQHPSTDTILDDARNTTSVIDRQMLLERFSQTRLKQMLLVVGHKVRDNTSSMLQDVRAGRQTEIQDFNGWLVDVAAFLDPGLDTSNHELLIELVENGVDVDETSIESHFPVLSGQV
ncbi:Ketoisovalerate reductase BEA2 like protein [Verticillium longisporum]|nr:Ketoisovalerate reductase BEA2 like protein [Verticillium longisporum]